MDTKRELNLIGFRGQFLFVFVKLFFGIVVAVCTIWILYMAYVNC